MARRLEAELEECGCSLTPAQFRDLLEELKAATSPSWTSDDLVCHPDEAKAFCEMIRTETNCPRMSDFLILRTLINARKAH
jgi:hypothetical protein